MRDSDLQSTALRYAAGDLSPDAAAAFEQLLADDQAARDALSEAVRLSAAAIGQASPAPDRSFRTRIRARLGLSYRGHPLVWASLGAAAMAVCAMFAVSAADRAEPVEEAVAAPAAPVAVTTAPPPSELPDAAVAANDPPQAACDERSVAEIWADLSSHDGVEKARDDEMRWRQRMRDLSNPNHVSATAKADGP